MRNATYVKRGFPSYLSHLVEIGGWHSHPGRNGTPSPADMECWADVLRCSRGLPYYVGIIATRAEDGLGWFAPQYSAWVTYQSAPRSTLFITKPARIVDGGY